MPLESWRGRHTNGRPTVLYQYCRLCLHHFTRLVFKTCQIFCWRYTF